jgi:hypothetical protein
VIEWGAFASVALAAVVSACLFVALFSFGLRLGDGKAAWRRPVSIVLFTLCGCVVLFGIAIIVPWGNLIG